MTARSLGFWAGPAIFVLARLLPPAEGMSESARDAAAAALWMACWWLTEALPLAATALLPLVLFPTLDLAPMQDTAAAYADPTIFLFMGGFFMAAAMERWGLHRRIALTIILWTGLSPSRIILGFMLATAFISLWISNTATTVMMLPIALAVARQVAGAPQPEQAGPQGEGRPFARALMLGVAYSATIGGIGTLIGTPPNLVFAGVARRMFPDLAELTFLRWLAFGAPMVAIYLPLAWFYLTRVSSPLHRLPLGGSRESVAAQRAGLGPMSTGERITLATLAAAGLLWIFRADIALGAWTIPGWAPALGLGERVGDATVAMAAALFLFACPVQARRRACVLDWEAARSIPWGILILFGGGFALALAVQRSGLAAWTGEALRGIAGWPPLLMIGTVAACVTLMSEFASNTAIAATFMPILGVTAQAAGLHPYVLMAPGAMAATLGFMLPVSTPPNAIVFGTGYIRVPEMMRAGIWMDAGGTVLVALIVRYVSLPLLGIRL
jgi:sodium-dependent dicarboxylate transporter 2/3/5